MLKVRLLRVLLPALLLLLAGVVIWTLKPPRPVHSGDSRDAAGDQRAEGLTFIELVGDEQNVAGDIELVEHEHDGRLHLEGIRSLQIHRQDGGPLVVSAEVGDGEGLTGQRIWHFNEGVVLRDPEEELRLELPVLTVDEAAGKAHSEGAIRFEGPGMSGTATGLIYDLRGEPSELMEPEFQDAEGARLTAKRARLLDGLFDVELIDEVRMSRPGQQLQCDRLRVRRRPDKSLERAEAEGRVSGHWLVEPSTLAELEGGRLELEWDEQGDPRRLTLIDDALISYGSESLAATTIDARRRDDGEAGWFVDAREKVYAQGMFGQSPGLLRAGTAHVVLDEAFEILSAEAQTRVSYEGAGTRAEAARATYSAAGAFGEVHLFSGERRKARLASGKTRIAADRIRTDLRGNDLLAEGEVESSLLPGALATEEDRQTRMFEADQAVHFVSERLQGSQAGSRLDFIGSVRGWQGERNLAADRVIVDQQRKTLEALDNVATRFPREAAGATLAEADYIQVGAQRLTYDDAIGQAVYSKGVNMRLVEGWLEAERVEVDLGQTTRRIEEVRAYEGVRLEFHSVEEQDPAPPITGSADRLVYEPSGAVVMLYGDQAPASVRRSGQGGGTTTGRVLRYWMENGALEVESGGQGPARIRTSNG